MSNTDGEFEYRGPDLPRQIGENLQIAFGLSDRPETFGDWVAGLTTVADQTGIRLDLDTLCTTDDSPHQATFNGTTQQYLCPQDAFIVPFLAADVETVEIETASPVSGEDVTITVTESTVDVEPPEAIMSFGVAADVTPPAKNVNPIRAYAHVCPYGNAFSSRTEYEAWASGIDAYTMAVSMEDTLEFGRALGQIT